MVPRPEGRDLDPEELREVVDTFAARPELWRGRVRHPEERFFEQLHFDQHLGVWLICWDNGHDTGFHDHDISSGAFAVVQGRLREERLRWGAPPTSVAVGVGGGSHFTPLDIHRVMHDGSEPAVSIHAYSPPLVRMGSYVIEPGGALLRQPLGPTEELRPLPAAA